MLAVLYHGNCPDGFGAAWAAWCQLRDSAVYLPVLYGTPPPILEPDATVFLMDFSYPREQLLSLRDRVGRLVVLDHHHTAQRDLEGLDFCTFDLTKSGARLAWERFHTAPPPPLIRYVEDRDLWRFALPHSRAVAAWLRSFPKEFRTWNDLNERLTLDLAACANEGEVILRFQGQQVEEMCTQAEWRDIGGYRVPAANATCFFSEVGERLCELHPAAPFAAYYLDRADGKRQWGLRSRNGFDVSAVATALGGGGHPAAAGFVEDVTMGGKTSSATR